VSSFGRNVLWGLALGLFGAVFFSVIAIVFWILGGPGVFEGNGTTLGATLLAYLVGGLLAGGLLGVLRPIARHWVGAAIVGVVCATAVYGAIAVSIEGLTIRSVKTALIAGILLGPFFGVGTRYQWPRVIQKETERYSD